MSLDQVDKQSVEGSFSDETLKDGQTMGMGRLAFPQDILKEKREFF